MMKLITFHYTYSSYKIKIIIFNDKHNIISYLKNGVQILVLVMMPYPTNSKMPSLIPVELHKILMTIHLISSVLEFSIYEVLFSNKGR